MNLLISPHQDDETLFAAYTCLRYKPLVLVCLRSFIEADWPNGPTWEVREKETAAACEILGCNYAQLTMSDNAPDWAALKTELENIEEKPEHVFAPLPEPDGHLHHNAIGEIAREVFPDVKFYSTYTRANGKTTTGEQVTPEEGWEALKRAAMACYVSQATHPMTQAAFNEWPIDEYLS